MKTPARSLLFGAFAALFLAVNLAVFAEDNSAPATPPAATAPAAQPAKSADDKSGLRRLDQPSDTPAAPAEDHDEQAAPADDQGKPTTPTPPPADKKHRGKSYSHSHRGSGDSARVTIGGSSTLEKGETADAVVSIFGSSTSAGTVDEAVVSVFGTTRVTGGSVGQASVAVLGDNYTNARVNDAVVAVLGNVELGPNADVGNVVCIGGRVERDPHAIVRGQVNHVGIGEHFGGIDWLRNWFKHCLLLGRMLAFDPNLQWAWWIALIFLGVYALIAVAFPRSVEKCAETLEQRPGYTVLATVLTALFTPILVILLAFTGIGLVVVPFIFFATLFGKVVILAWLGRRILALGGGARTGPATALAVLIGGAVVLLLYTVPILGIVVFKLVGLLGFGAVVYTLIRVNQRKPAAPIPPATPGGSVPPAVQPIPPSAAMGIVAPAVASEAGLPPTGAADAGSVPPSVPPPLLPPMPPLTAPPISVATLPRAGFWIRLAASAIDAVLIGIAFKLLPDVLHPNFLLAYAVYCMVMWALKGTTVGGVVCGLKVVRLDDRPLDWMTALVRSLGGVISLCIVGLGFIWVSFDAQSQSWHDKIAGTTVVRVPKGVSLV